MAETVRFDIVDKDVAEALLALAEDSEALAALAENAEELLALLEDNGET